MKPREPAFNPDELFDIVDHDDRVGQAHPGRLASPRTKLRSVQQTREDVVGLLKRDPVGLPPLLCMVCEK